jgi:hypothetical protein
MTTAQIQAPPNTRRLTVKPSEIRAGDWMRDLGRLRQVETIEPVGDGISRADGEARSSELYVIRFADEPDGDFATMGVWEAFPATIWREL